MTQEQADRIERKIDKLIKGLFGKQKLFGNAGDDGAPARVEPVEGYEKIFGPKPHPSKATEGTIWRDEIPTITKVYDNIPDEYESGAMKLAAATGLTPVFCEYLGETKVCLKPGLSPWLIDANNFVGSNVQGVIRAVLDGR